uniref:response regulator n=1 Tax=Trichocoleus desertorum TaxID=1481672 RepID=UPI0025B3C649|nr:response regulator [Trichocoleus desertorum]
MYQIAIVDDNESWCFILATRLRQHQYAVSTFTDTDLFLNQADQFDLALIDFSMPPRRYQIDTDGPDVIRKLKQRLDNPPLVILISSFFTEDILNDVAELDLQADAYLSKSVKSVDLLQEMERLLATRRSLARDTTKDEINTSYPSHKNEINTSHPSQSDQFLESDPSSRHLSSLKNFSRSH